MKVGMKKLLMLLAMSCSAAWAQPDANTARFMANAGFEEGKDNVPSWRANGAKNLKFARDTTTFRSGGAALKIEVGNGATPGEGGLMTDLWRAVPAGAFTLSGWIKTTGHFEKLQIAAQSLGDGWAGKDWIVVADVKPAEQWQSFSKEIKFSADSKFALMHVQAKGQGTIWLDDLKIVTADAPQINAQADAKSIARQIAQYRGENLYKWDQVFVGGGGTTTVLAIHPKDPTVIYAGMDVAGPMRWDVKAKRWFALTDHVPPSQAELLYTECLALDPNDPNVLFYSAGKDWVDGSPSISKSTDKGKTWTVVPLKNRDGKDVYITNGRTGKRLAVDPHNSNIIYYGSRRDGLFKSTDGGLQWTQLTNFPVAGESPDGMSILFVMPFAGSGKAPNGATKTIYVGASFNDKAKNGIYRSEDGAMTWTKLPDGGWGVGDLDGNGTLYVAGRGVQRWKNGAWEDITPDKSRGYSTLAISPFDPNLIAVTQDHCGWGNNFFRTADGGKTWAKFSDEDFDGRGKKNVHAEDPPWEGGNNGSHIFACASMMWFDGANPKKLWLSHWPGIMTCDDITANELHWRAEVKGHEEVCLFELMSPPKGAPLFSGMMDVGGFRHPKLDEMPPKQMIGIKTPYNNAPEDITDLDFCEAQPNFIAVTGGWKYQDWNNDPKKAAAGFSRDGGETWQNFASVPFEGARGGRLAVNAADPKNMVWIPRDTLGGTNKGNTPAYFTKDGGATWQGAAGAPLGMIYGEFVYTFYQPLESDRVQANTFYLYDRRDGRFYRSEDGAANWKHVSRLPGQSGAHFDRHWLRAMPGKAGEIWAALDKQGLFRSSDGGGTWTKLEGVERAWAFGWGKGKTAPIAYVLGKVTGDTIAQDVALYRSDDMGKTWQRLNGPEQGWGQGITVVGDRQTEGRVYVGTNGRGIFYGDY
jgi:hypothetical protein